MSRISVGDVFEFEGSKFCVKKIDYTGEDPTNKSKEPRLDASEFIVDEEGIEKLKKGRPRRFDIEKIHTLLEKDLPEEYENNKSTSKVDEFRASVWSTIDEIKDEEFNDESSSTDEIEEVLSDPESW